MTRRIMNDDASRNRGTNDGAVKVYQLFGLFDVEFFSVFGMKKIDVGNGFK